MEEYPIHSIKWVQKGGLGGGTPPLKKFFLKIGSFKTE